MNLITITFVAWLQLITASVDDNNYNYLFKTNYHGTSYNIAWSEDNVIQMKLKSWKRFNVIMKCHDAHQYDEVSHLRYNIKICTATEIKEL